MEYREFTAKNVDDAITEACESLCVTSDRLDYEVVTSGSAGFLGINAKPAVIKARIKEDKPEEKVEVSNEELDAELAKMGEQYKMTADQVKQALGQQIVNFRHNMLMQKIEAFLYENNK